jgi:hypothetical protein
LTPEERRTGGLPFVISGDAPGGSIIETSTDLIHWTSLQILPAAEAGDEWVGPPAPEDSSRFVRVRVVMP